jgi:serine/threonine protein kinase
MSPLAVLFHLTSAPGFRVRQDGDVVTPDRIGRYPVSRQLGSGGFATVWLAFDDVLNTHVAIKVLAENWSHMPDIRDRFLQEAKLLRKADSDRVVRVFDIGELADGRPYFVMSYADRRTVAERLADGPLPVPQALHIAIETARAVAVLHRMDVIHRDIKPSNVLIQSTPDGGERILIGDLGIAKSLAFASGFTNACGTPGYMAPEQAIPNFGLDVRADVYGLGALTYHLITGRKYNDTTTPDEEPRSDLPKKLARTVLRALKPDRNRRYPDADSFANALTRLLPARKQTPAPARPIMSRRRVHLALAALALAAWVTAALVSSNRNLRDGSGVPDPITSTTTSTSPSSPAPTATKLEFTFAIDPVPGYRVDQMTVYGNEQSAGIIHAADNSLGGIRVYGPGAFDPRQAQSGEPVTVAGRKGFLVQSGSDTSVVLEYAPDAWYEVGGFFSKRDVQLQVAAAVRFGVHRPLRFPMQLGYLPAGLRVCGGEDNLEPVVGPWAAEFLFCDRPPAPDHVGALRVAAYLDRRGVPPKNSRRINGAPFLVENNSATVDYGDFVLHIEARGDKKFGIPAEFEKMVQAITVKRFADRSNWFAGSEAIPTGS